MIKICINCNPIQYFIINFVINNIFNDQFKKKYLNIFEKDINYNINILIENKLLKYNENKLVINDINNLQENYNLINYNFIEKNDKKIIEDIDINILKSIIIHKLKLRKKLITQIYLFI